MFFILLMSFELCGGAAEAFANRFSKNKTAAPARTNGSGRSGEI
jgi:hypothetical protein